jgi:hypothetical protein
MVMVLVLAREMLIMNVNVTMDIQGWTVRQHVMGFVMAMGGCLHTAVQDLLPVNRCSVWLEGAVLIPARTMPEGTLITTAATGTAPMKYASALNVQIPLTIVTFEEAVRMVDVQHQCNDLMDRCAIAKHMVCVSLGCVSREYHVSLQLSPQNVPLSNLPSHFYLQHPQ